MTEGEVNKTQNSVRLEPCGQCDRQTRRQVLASYDVEEQYGAEDFLILKRDYEIVQCLGCLQPSLRFNWTRPDDHDDDCEALDHIELYPSRIAGRRPLRDNEHLPDEVLTIYLETHVAVCNRLRILAGIGIRALVEAVCNEKNASGRDLKERIDDLARKGLLTAGGAEILHSTRLLGNKAAHEVRPLSEASLNAAMDVAEHLLTSVYLLPRTARQLPQRHLPAGGGATP